jgi:hypothetical protein
VTAIQAAAVYTEKQESDLLQMSFGSVFGVFGGVRMVVRRVAGALIVVCLAVSFAACNPATTHRSSAVPSSTSTAFPHQTTISACPQDEPALDDRSTASQLVRSYFNAIDRREYLRAYTYLFPPPSSGATPTPQPSGTPVSPQAQFERWMAGYQDTACVIITGLGLDSPGTSPSLIVVPITFVAVSLEGDVADYTGDYIVQFDPALGVAQSGFLNLPLSTISAV